MKPHNKLQSILRNNNLTSQNMIYAIRQKLKKCLCGWKPPHGNSKHYLRFSGAKECPYGVMFQDGYIHTLVTGGYLDTSQLFLSRKTGLEKRSPIIKDMGIIALFPPLALLHMSSEPWSQCCYRRVYIIPTTHNRLFTTLISKRSLKTNSCNLLLTPLWPQMAVRADHPLRMF